MLFHVSSRDPMIFGAVAAMLMLVALAASLIPARLATMINPTEALRIE